MRLDALCQAIGMEDVKGLTAIQGVGKKTAERICVELKDKVGTLQVSFSGTVSAMPEVLPGEGSPAADALSALINLGYPDPVARQALAGVRKRVGEAAFADLRLEELIREGLRSLA